MKFQVIHLLLFSVIFLGCNQFLKQNEVTSPEVREDSISEKIRPILVTEPVLHDSDDPAIWIDSQDASKSLILATDKDEKGAIYVYDLKGKIIREKVVKGLRRPNNIDVDYGLTLNGQVIDIAVVTERLTNKLRVFRLPDMVPIDNGGIDVFEGENFRAPMGIALYKRPSDSSMYAIVGRKDGPEDGTYLWQYLLTGNKKGYIEAKKVREFGNYSGTKEIEAIAVDDQLGYVYYSDEKVGVRKYYADPDSTSVELAKFATSGFTGDHEGISVFAKNDGTGFILVSDQQANKFHIYTREGTGQNPNDHRLVKIFDASTISSDGSEVTSVALSDIFPKGLFVAMSDDRTFQYYSWKDIIGN